MDSQASRLVSQGLHSVSRGNHAHAVELLRRALTQEPDDARAHAVLALALVGTKRLHAARVEAQLALTLEPTLALAHHAAGAVALAQRDFGRAETHFVQLLEMEPDEPGPRRALAQLYGLTRRSEQGRALLQQALELGPEDPDTLADLGSMELAVGRRALAEQHGRAALEIEPQHVDALVLMGSIELRAGNLDSARDHAAWALQIDPNDHGALHLLAGIKARRNPLLSLWWRYNIWMGELGANRAIVVLLGAFVVYRIARLALLDADMVVASRSIQYAWLAICAYTWFGPVLFKRSLDRELADVELGADF